MDVLDILQKLEGSDGFKAWIAKNPNSYLVHVFKMHDSENLGEWQIGYYNENDTISTFIVDGKEILRQEESAIFKESDNKLLALSRNTIKIGMDDALLRAQNLLKEKYSKHPVLKVFVILQNLKNLDLYNVTFVTHTLHTINIRVSATDGLILSDKITNIMDFKVRDETPSSET